MKKAPLRVIYARNFSYEMWSRDWGIKETAQKLGTTDITISRIRQARNSNLDMEVLTAAVEAFECDFNRLLLPRDDISYSSS